LFTFVNKANNSFPFIRISPELLFFEKLWPVNVLAFTPIAFAVVDLN